jgi:hypothetical protein
MLTQSRLQRSRLGWRNRRDSFIDGRMNQWRNGLTGSLLSNSEEIAANFLRALSGTSYRNKVVYFNALLGANLNASLRALINELPIGATATNIGLVDADFSQATGWQGNGSSKIVNTGAAPSQLGTSSNGGLFYWELAVDQSGTSTIVMGMIASGGTTRYAIDLRNTGNNEFLFWGGPANGPTTGVAATNSFYLGQRSSSTSRELFRNGASVATNTTSDTAAGVADVMLHVLGYFNGSTYAYNKSRCGLFGMTDGTMTANEVAAFYVLLRDYIMRPTGRITS